MAASGRENIRLHQKLGLMAFGLFLTFIILEVTLRLGGLMILSLQAHRNALSLRQKGVYRIMCIGESTTQGQYPALLEQVLNGRNMGIKFSVIDRGLSGTDTSFLLHRLESDLDAYHPDMVVAMMGINDNGPHMPYEPESSSKIVRLLRTLRTYKLTRIAWLHIASLGRRAWPAPYCAVAGKVEAASADVDKIDGPARRGIRQGRVNQGPAGLWEDPAALSGSAEAAAAYRKALEINPRNDAAYVGLAGVYQRQGEFGKAAATYWKALEINPRNDAVYMGLAGTYPVPGKPDEVAAPYQKALGSDPRNDAAYAGLAGVYQRQGRFAQAAAAYQKALEINPRNAAAHVGLDGVHRVQGKFAEAAAAYQKVLESDPRNDAAFVELAGVYQGQGRFMEAEAACQKALEINPRNVTAYVGLAGVYQGQGKFAEAAAAYQKALESNPGNDGADAGLRDSGLAERYRKKAGELRLKGYNAVVADNYRRLKEKLDRRGVQLVCVQYPMRSVEPLRKMFQGRDDGIIFVDNEKVFRDAAGTSSGKDYFSDMFAGDFGHCTRKGNELLAGNIADALWRDSFRK